MYMTGLTVFAAHERLISIVFFFLFSAAIGAYEPRHILHHQHISPLEALKIHTEINATHTVGVHWGTFMMSDEHYLDPPKVLEKGRRETGLGPGTVGVVRLGETVRVGEGMFGVEDIQS